MSFLGAAHIHGTLWLDLEKIEKVRIKNGKLENSGEKGPMKGLCQAFRKLKNSEILKKEDTESLANFVDAYMTVSTSSALVGEEIAATAKEVNQHKHTVTCRKYGGKCRFNYPRPPAPHTIIVQPVVESDTAKRNKIINDSYKIIGQVMEVMNDKEKLKKVMDRFDKDDEKGEEISQRRIERIKKICKMAEVSYEEYIKALGVSNKGYSVIYKRDIDELFMNPYNIEWMQAWDGNLDIQPCLDYFAVSTYITDYYAKADTAMMTALKTAMKASNENEIKEKMKVVANLFLTHRQIGEAEAVYRLIPSLTLSMSNIACQFLFTARKEERSMRWKRATEEQLQKGIRAKRLDQQEGFWYKQPDLWNKYLRRPNEVKDICCAQFARMYKGVSPKEGKTNDDEDDEIPEVFEDEDDADDEDGDEFKFNFMMTYRENGKKGKPLPGLIKLLNPYPGEAVWMKKRSRPVALRYHKYQKDNDHKRYMLSEIMKYTPLDDEVEDDKIEELYNEMIDGVRKIEIVKRQVMPHLEGVTEARYYVEKMNKEVQANL